VTVPLDPRPGRVRLAHGRPVEHRSRMAQVAAARSVSRSVRPLLEGPVRHGVGLGRGYVAVGDYCLALVPPGLPRMPNGIVCDLVVAVGEPVRVGAGRVSTASASTALGPDWDPVPVPRIQLMIANRFTPDPVALAGRGDGLTPAGDDLLVGYAAGLVLFHGRRDRATAIAEAAAPRTTLLSATLLRHAAVGELPEPAHAFLEGGDPQPMLRFGHSSGRAMLMGLALAC